MKVLRLLEEGRTLWFIDESWCPEVDYRRRKWRSRGDSNAVNGRLLSYRVSMIVAVSTDGGSYMSLQMGNTNQDVFMLFLAQLAQRLREEDPDFRSKVVLVVDGCAFHKGQAVRNFVRDNQLPYLLMGPYGYASSVCELYWAALKSTNLNMENEGIDKK